MSANIIDIHKKYEVLTKYLIDKKITITTMESCTSGLVASLITDTLGASEILKGAFITYSNKAKIEQGVSKDVIERYGVYSKETAKAMACSCKEKYGADIGIGITGSVGKVDPNNADSVLGEVYVCVYYGNKEYSRRFYIKDYSNRFEAKLMIAEKVFVILSEIFELRYS